MNKVKAYYRTDLTDPLIRHLYDRYKAKHQIPKWCPLSDAERRDFDNKVIEYFQNRKTPVDAGTR